MFHVFSLVCFLIYGVKRRQVLIAKLRCYFYFPDFTPFIFLLMILCFLLKLMFFNKIGPIWIFNYSITGRLEYVESTHYRNSQYAQMHVG